MYDERINKARLENKVMTADEAAPLFKEAPRVAKTNAFLGRSYITPSTFKNDTISHLVPMASHIDNTEHDVDIIVTENGLANLRGLAPRERAQYFFDACRSGGHTPHLLQKAHCNSRSVSRKGAKQLSSKDAKF